MAGKPKSRNEKILQMWRKIEKRGKCWIWRGKCSTVPMMTLNGGSYTPVRKMVRESLGLDDDGLRWRTCDERRCVNPDHTALVGESKERGNAAWAALGR